MAWPARAPSEENTPFLYCIVTAKAQEGAANPKEEAAAKPTTAGAAKAKEKAAAKAQQDVAAKAQEDARPGGSEDHFTLRQSPHWPTFFTAAGSPKTEEHHLVHY